MLVNVAVTVPICETVKGKNAVAPTPSVPENVSVVVGGAGVVVVVVVVVVVGDAVLWQAAVSNGTTTNQRKTARMITLRNGEKTRPKK